MLQFMPPWNYNRPPQPPPPEMCTVWPQLMLTAPSRKTGSHRIKRENESKFWPDNVLMIFLFFFFFSVGEETKHFLATKMCLAISWSSAQHVFRLYWRRYCLQTDGSFFIPHRALFCEPVDVLQEITVVFRSKSTNNNPTSQKKNGAVDSSLLMTLNFNKDFGRPKHRVLFSAQWF